jgi:predicted RNA-binding protein YlqC (UPF0109 family)
MTLYAAAAELKRQTATVDCPKSMVGRVIGKNGETIKALQTYTGALIQIDQTVEPTKVTISGTPHSLSLAVSMVTDIVKGTFKGFALLRQITNAGVRPAGIPPAPMAQPRPVYAPGYGLIPPSQVGAHECVRADGMLGKHLCALLRCHGLCSQPSEFAYAIFTRRTPLSRPQLYGADDRTAGVVAVGRQQGPMSWPPAGQVVPSQVILVRACRALVLGLCRQCSAARTAAAPNQPLQLLLPLRAAFATWDMQRF